jgi:hypothetical protein
VGPRAGLDDLEKRKFLTLPGLKLRFLGRPARSQSLYRLAYPGSLVVLHTDINIKSKHCVSGNHVAWLFPCHHGIARPQVVDGRRPPDMEDSCKYMEPRNTRLIGTGRKAAGAKNGGAKPPLPHMSSWRGA